MTIDCSEKASDEEKEDIADEGKEESASGTDEDEDKEGDVRM